MAITPEYLAGFFDGEGYVYVSVSRRQQYVLVGIANTHFNVLKQLQEMFGGTLYPKKRRSINHSQGWELRWSGAEQTKKVLEFMLPHLIVKKAEVQYLLSNWYDMVRRTGRGHGWTDEELKDRARVVSTFKEIRASERKVNQHDLIN